MYLVHLNKQKKGLCFMGPRTSHHGLRRVAVAKVGQSADDSVDARHHDFGARAGDHESLQANGGINNLKPVVKVRVDLPEPRCLRPQTCKRSE